MLPAPDKPIVCYVTDRQAFGLPDADTKLRSAIHLAATCGVDWIQIREKDLIATHLLALTADALHATSQNTRTDGQWTRVLVNDRVDVAVAAGAQGVHLGQASIPIREVSTWRGHGSLPRDFTLGVSCHSVQEARAAADAGADYIFFGPIFDTPSKRRFGVPQGTDRLNAVCNAVRIPVIAIGGVNQANGGECIVAGAAGVAAIRMFQEANDQDGLREAIEQIRNAKR